MTFLIAAHNEEEHIAAKFDNALAQDLGEHSLEIPAWPCESTTLLAIDRSFPQGAAGQRHSSEHHPDGRYPYAFQSKSGKSLQAKSAE